MSQRQWISIVWSRTVDCPRKQSIKCDHERVIKPDAAEAFAPRNFTMTLNSQAAPAGVRGTMPTSTAGNMSGNPAIENELKATLVEQRGKCLSYLRRNLRDPNDAEDVLHDFIERALRKGCQVQRKAALSAWLWCVLRSALVDHCRRRSARLRAERTMIDEWSIDGPYHVQQDDREPVGASDCAWMEDLLTSLTPDHSEAISRIDLAGQKPKLAAAELGISEGNMRVRIHRAHKAARLFLKDYRGSPLPAADRHCS